MKTTLLALFLSIALFGCSGKLEKTYSPRDMTASETFDEIPKSKGNILKLVKIDSNRADRQDHFEIQFRDTTISVQDTKNAAVSVFKGPRFINSQKTAVIAEVADSSALSPRFYLISLKGNVVDVANLNKPSSRKQNPKYDKGIVDITRTNFVINNDFIVNSVNGKVYSIKRKNPEEQIPGELLMYSRDRTTLVFLTKDALYQVNYYTGESETLPLSAKALANLDGIRGEVAQNYSWATNKNGTPFLRYNGDPDRIVDIKEFQK